jgi:hypothetical protein
MKPIDYGEYKAILDATQRVNVEDTYQDLMQKEDDVLKTVNEVVRYHRDTDIKEGEFIYQGVNSIVRRFLDVWGEMIEGITNAKSLNDVISMLGKKDHPIYIGMTLIVIALFLFLIESSKWD